MKNINPISYLKPLRIQIGAAVVKVGEVAPCCGSVRVEGWIEAPCKREGFGASLALGAHLGRKSVGGYCDARTEFEAVSFPFSFDVEQELVAPSYRRENMEESMRRVILTLWRARRHFAKLNWNEYGQCVAHWYCDPQPYKKQTLDTCFKNPLGR